MSKVSTVIELVGFLKDQKKYWMIPIIVIFLILGVLIILGESSVVAPFIYTLF